jgi:hypothetical protein
MARDPQMPLTDVQWVLGHAHLSTTQLYLTQGSGIASDGREKCWSPDENGILSRAHGPLDCGAELAVCASDPV